MIMRRQFILDSGTVFKADWVTILVTDPTLH